MRIVIEAGVIRRAARALREVARREAEKKGGGALARDFQSWRDASDLSRALKDATPKAGHSIPLDPMD
jgi:hypothetical protein